MSAAARFSVVKTVATALYRAGGVQLLAAAADRLALGPGYVPRPRTPAFPILVYHRVNDEGDPFFPALPTEIFEQEMAYVARSYRVLTVEELVDRARRGTVPRNALAITFDDGYRDNLTHAAPILARHGLPATIFLATGFIGTAEVPWWDRLATGLKATLAAAFRAPWGETIGLAGAPERVRALGQLLRHFKALPEHTARRCLEETLETLGVTGRQCFKNEMLSWDDVHALTGLGFSIGAHTVQHPILSRVTVDRAREEIVGSRKMIEVACGRPPLAFAYPNGGPGDYTETVKQLVRQAAFTCAVTTRMGLNTRDTSPWELRRGGPWEHHLPTFALKLAWYRMSLS